MREIKFRIWDKQNKEMLDLEDLHYEYGKMSIRTTMYNDYFDTEDMILMQYTGIKDKNGIEIYENDILREYSNEIEDWVISYEYGKFIGTCNGICEDLYELSDLEVIGNIYDK